MTDLPAPNAARLRPPSWRDTRLIIGLVIVLASVALGARVVAAADDTVPVYAAASALPSGHQLGADALRVVRVRLGSGAAAYLSAATPLPAGATLLRPLGEGELIPRSAIGSAAALDRRPVSIPLGNLAPDDLRPGALVDLWSSAKDPAAGSTVFRPPVQLSRNAEVYAVNGTSGAGTGLPGQSGSVQVLLDDAELRAVLDALANGARLALVPQPGAAAGPPSAALP